MSTVAEKEDLLWNFARYHDDLNHITYHEEHGTPENQEWVALLVSTSDASVDHKDYMDELMETEGNVIVDPNWDEIAENFRNSSGRWDDARDYFMPKIDALDTPAKRANFLTKYVLKKMKERGVVADRVYVVIKSHWQKTMYDRIEEI